MHIPSEDRAAKSVKSFHVFLCQRHAAASRDPESADHVPLQQIVSGALLAGIAARSSDGLYIREGFLKLGAATATETATCKHGALILLCVRIGIWSHAKDSGRGGRERIAFGGVSFKSFSGRRMWWRGLANRKFAALAVEARSNPAGPCCVSGWEAICRTAP